MAAKRIATYCEACGERVEVPASSVVLYDTVDRKAYEYSCPSCGQLSVKATDERIRELLKANGVRVVEDEAYPELIPPALPPLELDDLIDAHAVLDEELAALLRHGEGRA